MPSPSANRLTQQHRRRLALLSASVTSGVVSVAMGADPADIDTWYLGAVDGIVDRVLTGYGAARRMSTDYLRRHSVLERHPVNPVPASLDMNRARTSLRITGPVAFKTAISAGQSEAQAVATMASRMSGAASRLALDGDRETFEQTMSSGQGIVGYRRVLGGPGCGFCAMLASRGAVYLSESSASRTKDGLRFHDHCRCSPVPLYTHEDEPSEVRFLQRLWNSATRGHTGDGKARAWRRTWEARQRAIRAAEPGGATKIPALSTSPALPGPTGAGAGAIAAVAIRPVLASAKTLNRVGEVFRSEFERITGRRTLLGADFTGNLQTAREHAEGLLRGLERFPDVNLVRVSAAKETAYAQVTTWGELPATAVASRVPAGARIEFNDRWTRNRQKYVDSLTSDSTRVEYGGIDRPGFHVPNSGTPMSVAVHEFGHALDMSTLGEAIRPDLDDLLTRRAVLRDADLHVREQAGEVILDDRGVKGLIEAEVSGYALKNRRELVAEAFADVMMNGPAASQLSREIFDLLEAAYRKGGKRVGVVATSASEAADLSKMTVVQLKALAKARGITGYSKLTKPKLLEVLSPAPAKKAAKKAAAKTVAAKAVDPAKAMQSGDFSALTRVSGQTGGTNPGGVYRAADGSEWYVKQLADAEHVRNEVLAANLYRAAGIDVPEIVAGKGAPGLTGDTLIASRIDPRSVPVPNPMGNFKLVDKLREGFAVDAWLANWDVMGGGFSNLVGLTRRVGGREIVDIRRIDVGGALLFRGGVGLPKGAKFGDTVPEWRTLRDPSRSSHAARIYAGMSKTELTAAVDRVKAITPTKIRSLVKQSGMPPDLADKLIARRADLLDQLKHEFAPPPKISASIKTARDKFDASLATGRVNQSALDQAPLRMVGDDTSFNLTFEGSWSRVPAAQRARVQNALKKYRGNDFEDINGVLRGKQKATATVNGWIDAIEAGLAKSKLQDSVIVWRGVKTGESVFGPRASWPADLTGVQWTDPAFFSTSVDRGNAEFFAGKVLMRFVFPKGTPAIQLSGYEYEAELMIGHGYTFRVIRDRGQGSVGSSARVIDRILDVEVIPPKRRRKVAQSTP